MRKYIDAAVLYDMTEQENDYIMSLSESWDFERLLDIYIFLQYTKHDISLMESMYKFLENNYFSHFELENAYTYLVGKQDDELSLDDIFDYTSRGASVDDILYAYELSLRGDKTIRNILDEKLSGKSVGAIAADLLREDGVTADTFKGIDTFEEVSAIISFAKITNEDICDALKIVDGKATLTDEAIEKYVSKNDEIEIAIGKVNVKSLNDKNLISAAKKELKNMDEKTIEELFSQGYRIRDIKQEIEGVRVPKGGLKSTQNNKKINSKVDVVKGGASE